MKSRPGGGHVAVVGAGFSGTMLAVHLLRQGLKVTLIDRSGRFGEGLAYSTREPIHLLNVPAAKMSAFPDDPRHFARWLEDRGEGDGTSFAPRRTYRAYLAEIFQVEGSAANCVHDTAVAIADGKLRLASGSLIECDAAVIAAGNLGPAPVPRLGEAAPLCIDDPWSADGRAALSTLARQDGDLLLVGTGLTMVDTVLSLESQGFAGRVIAISRRGLLPRAHFTTASIDIELPASLRLADLLRWTRSHAGAANWTAVIDALRPITAKIWQSWSGRERSRFLRHLRPWWDVHRHRIAPQIWAQLDGLRKGGLSICAGRIVGGDGTSVRIRRRGATATETIRTVGIVNCTGPRGDIRAAADPLLDSLLANGMARTDDFGLGLEVDDQCRVSHRLYAVGPMTRGTFWEIVAVPDIRGQVQRLAATIAADLSQAAHASAWHGAPAARYAG